MAEKLYFGVPGNIQEIPYPVSGMGFDSNVDAEVTELVSGGRSIYRAPTAYKSLNPSWRSNSSKLAHLIDMYNGQFGPGPFYMTDPTANQLNVLPSRWSNAWQLAHQSNGWCRPTINTTDGIPFTASAYTANTDRYVKFTQATVGPTVKTQGVLRTRMIRLPGKAYYLAVSGSATGGAGIKVRVFDDYLNQWLDSTTFTTLDGQPRQVVASTSADFTMIELDVYMPLGSTLTLKGLSLGTVDYSGVTGATRTNLLTNPSFEVDALGWTNVTRANSIAARKVSGTYYGQTTAAAVESTKVPATAGQSYAASAYASRGATAKTAAVTPIFYDASNVELSPPTITLAAITASETPQRFSTIRVAPAGTTQVALRLTGDSATITFDAALLEQSTTVGTYFDGSYSATGYLYGWTGTAHASSSTETVYSAPSVPWMPRGSGIGAVQFDNTLGGELVSSTIDRIGLTLTLTEVQSVESPML